MYKFFILAFNFEFAVGFVCLCFWMMWNQLCKIWQKKVSDLSEFRLFILHVATGWTCAMRVNETDCKKFKSLPSNDRSSAENLFRSLSSSQKSVDELLVSKKLRSKTFLEIKNHPAQIMQTKEGRFGYVTFTSNLSFFSFQLETPLKTRRSREITHKNIPLLSSTKMRTEQDFS